MTFSLETLVLSSILYLVFFLSLGFFYAGIVKVFVWGYRRWVG